MKALTEKIKKLITKELVLYVVFGVGTTLVNTAVFWLLSDALGVHYLAANIAAWVLAVSFAYTTNRLFVFISRTRGRAMLGEMAAFFAARLLSLGVDELGMYLMIDIGGVGEMAAKIVMNVLVIIINYVLSKWVIFGKKRVKQGEE